MDTDYLFLHRKQRWLLSYCRKNKVSYQPVYSLVKKYKSEGMKILKDRWERIKPEMEMTALEKLRAENRILKVKKQQQRMEDRLLKK